MQQEVTKVCVTGGAGQVGYSLCFMIAAGRLLGPEKKIQLTIIEVPHSQNVAEGLIMELKDCAFPTLAHVEYTTDAEQGFKGCDIALLVGARPRGPGMTRADLLKVNASIFKAQAQAIEKNANKDCKILVVGNPANTNAAIIAHYAPSLNKKNITSLTRLDMNRAKNLLAEKSNLPSDSVHNVIIWGNHSNTQFPHIGVAYAKTEAGN
jgi:malate dehydrogenase